MCVYSVARPTAVQVPEVAAKENVQIRSHEELRLELHRILQEQLDKAGLSMEDFNAWKDAL